MAGTNNTVRLVRWTAAMLATSSILFGAAVLIEQRGAPHAETAVATIAAPEQAEHNEVAKGGEHHDEGAEPGTPSHIEGAGEATEHGEQTILGINLEDPWVVWGFVAASLVVAVAMLLLGWPALLVAIVLAGVAAVLDGREVLIQSGAGNAAVASLASLTALAHLAVVVLAVLAWRALARSHTNLRNVTQ